MLFSDVEQLLKTWAADVVRNEMLAEVAKTERAMWMHEGVIDEGRRAMLDVLTFYWGTRRTTEQNYLTVMNALQDERIRVSNGKAREAAKVARQRMKSPPYPEWPFPAV